MKKIIGLWIAMFVLSLSSMVSAHDNPNFGLTPNYQMSDADEQPQLDPNGPHHKKPHKPQQPEQPQQPQPGQPEPPHDGGRNN
jgi:hypothetical protein